MKQYNEPKAEVVSLRIDKCVMGNEDDKKITGVVSIGGNTPDILLIFT